MQRSRRLLVVFVLSAVLCRVDYSALSTQHSAPGTVFAQTPAEARVTSLVKGLVNPRGIAFGPDGALYVAEAGSGGPDTPDIGPRGRRYRMGTTGRVSRVDLSGQRTVLLDNLPSLNNGEDELGAADLAFLDGVLYVLTAAGGYEIGNPAWDNVILRLEATAPTARAAPIFNLTEYNLANPSLSRQQDPIRTDVAGGMPFGLTALDGALYATDGNQEHVTRITPDGQARRILQYPMSNHVLTGIAAGPDHALYVSEFGPAPHKDNSARVTRVTPDGQASTAAENFVDAIDVAFDDLGRLYVLEFGRAGMRVPQSGRVLRILPDGGREVVVGSGLSFPTSMAFGPDGNLYLANAGHRASGGEGEILKVQLVPDPPAPPGPPGNQVAIGAGLGLMAAGGVGALVILAKRAPR